MLRQVAKSISKQTNKVAMLQLNQSRTMVQAIRLAQVVAHKNAVLTNVQVRMVHARGYNDFDDMEYHIFHEVNAALQNCHNVGDYAFVFRKYGEYLTDFQIAYAF
jgi:hypothetical protein